MKKILLIDGFSILNRAFYALPPLTTASGAHTGAIFGFLSILMRFLDEEKPDYITVAFDLPVPTFRHERYGAYKGTRKSMPDELREQVPTLKALLEKMGLPPAECAGYEADDIIGTLAKKAEANRLQIVIVSGDRDLLQLATETVCIRLPKTRAGKTEVETYFAKDVLEKYGVTPAAYIDVKALMGDASDNIPGVPGIGEVTATKIIVQYGTLENAIANAAEVKPKKASENLVEFAEQARISQMLATIVTDVPYELVLYPASEIWNGAALEEINRLELKQITKRLGKTSQVVQADAQTVQAHISNAAQAEKFFAARVSDNAPVAFYILWDGAEFVGMGVCTSDSGTFYFPSDCLQAAKPWLESPAPKYVYDIKEEARQLRNHGITLHGAVFDAMLAAYAQDTLHAEKTVPDLAAIFFGETLSAVKDLLEKKQTLADLPAQTLAVLSTGYAHVVFRLQPLLKSELYEMMEHPLAFVLAEMEQSGIQVNSDILAQYGEELTARINALTESIHAHAGESFNIQSPQQLGAVLFEKLGLRGGKKTKQGYSTAADVLEKLRPAHAIVGEVLEYRAHAKLKSTYIDGLIPLINPFTGRVHSTFHQALTATGRLSSAEPNLQNIPVRTQLGRELRKAFIPREGCVLVDADYSQIELRILAHMSADPVLVRAFQKNADIHRITASQVLHIAPEDVTPAQRSNAKAVNFGIIYGISAFGLSEDLKIPVWEADEYIAGYFTQYPKVKAFMDDCVAKAKETGYAHTLFDRRRAVPELKSHNFNIRSFGARVAMNMPIQGTAADIIKIAMIRVSQRLKSEGMESRLILQVHDELLLEVPFIEQDKAAQLVREEMESAASLTVPLVADVKIGESWYETK
ncbi:MAG: DNA polymerase I [Defluviitaleaceae bacterium]|nr:DNA polymerase I [Defluviitaleaceae bacterium]MCL2273745.1 DNA polymerase I [Defluviitaleaceae bacterium]